MVDELSILKELTSVVQARFDSRAIAIAQRSNSAKTFNVTDFSNFSLEDQQIKHEEFGLVHIVNSTYQVQDIVNGPHDAVQTVVYSIQVIIQDKGDLATQVSLARMALAETLLKEEFDLERFYDYVIEGTQPTPLDFGAKNDTIKYVMAGISLSLQMAV